MTYNAALHDIRHRDVDIKRWTNTNLNRWLADYISSFSASLRFVGELDAVARVFQTHLVPHPGFSFMRCINASIISAEKADHGQLSAADVVMFVFVHASVMDRFDPSAISLLRAVSCTTVTLY